MSCSEPNKIVILSPQNVYFVIHTGCLTRNSRSLSDIAVRHSTKHLQDSNTGPASAAKMLTLFNPNPCSKMRSRQALLAGALTLSKTLTKIPRILQSSSIVLRVYRTLDCHIVLQSVCLRRIHIYLLQDLPRLNTSSVALRSLTFWCALRIHQ